MTLDFGRTEAAFVESVVANVVDRDVVVAVGPDAAAFLHGQMSQNIEKLTVGASAWTLLLHPQGKIAGWGRVSRIGEEEFWFDLEAGFGAEAAERLSRFLLRTKATITANSWKMVQLRGPGAAVAAEGAVEGVVALSPLDADGAMIPGADLVGPNVEVPAGIELGDPAAFVAQRVQAKVPAMGHEVQEKTIPAELGIVEAAADFTKGCYVGQELVARVDSRGNNTPRKMHQIAGDGEAPEAGAELVVGDAAAGIVTTAVNTASGWVGFGSIKRGVDTPAVGTAGSQAVQIS